MVRFGLMQAAGTPGHGLYPPIYAPSSPGVPTILVESGAKWANSKPLWTVLAGLAGWLGWLAWLADWPRKIIMV